MSNDLAEKLNQKIEKEAGKHGKKIAAQKVEEKLGELDAKADKHLAGLQGKLEEKMRRGHLSLLASVYLLVAFEHIPVLIMLILIYFLSIILSLLVSLTIIIVAGIYLVAYIIIYRFPGMLKKGAMGFFFAIVLSVCEAFLVAFFTSVVSEDLLMSIVAIIIIDLGIVTVVAKVLKSKYKVIVGVLIGLGISIGIYAIYMLLVDFDWMSIIVSFILLNVYQSFLVIICSDIIDHDVVEDEDFNSAIFVTLYVYKKKIDYSLGLIFIIIQAIMKCCKKKENY